MDPDEYLELTDPIPVIKTTVESLALKFDFSGKLNACEELLACSSVSVIEGSTTITLGSAVNVTIDANKQVAWGRVSGGTVNTDSVVQCVCSTNQNNTVTLNRTINVRTK